LPQGTLFKVDSSVKNYDRSDNDFFNLHHSSDKYLYKVFDSKVQCLDCPADEDDYNDVTMHLEEEENNSITITKDGVSITDDTIKGSTSSIKELKINKDGIIIKTR
jgi:hypothetical protein